jgi:hypothetical protein
LQTNRPKASAHFDPLVGRDCFAPAAAGMPCNPQMNQNRKFAGGISQ